MVEHFDDLILLVQHSGGKNAAVKTYIVEMDVSTAEATRAVEELAKKYDIHDSGKTFRQISVTIVAALAPGILCLLSRVGAAHSIRMNHGGR